MWTIATGRRYNVVENGNVKKPQSKVDDLDADLGHMWPLWKAGPIGMQETTF